MKKCVNCSKELSGRKTKYCSQKCNSRYYFSNYYSENKNRYLQRIMGWERKKRYLKLLGGKCSSCGYDKNFAALHFHHIDPTTKKFNLDINNLNKKKEEEVLCELDKCIILCANYHAEHHYPERVWGNGELNPILND